MCDIYGQPTINNRAICFNSSRLQSVLQDSKKMINLYGGDMKRSEQRHVCPSVRLSACLSKQEVSRQLIEMEIGDSLRSADINLYSSHSEEMATWTGAAATGAASFCLISLKILKVWIVFSFIYHFCGTLWLHSVFTLTKHNLADCNAHCSFIWLDDSSDE